MDVVDVFKTLDVLIDRWCDRRAFGPLQALLQVYPGRLIHTDQKIDLLRDMKSVKSDYRSELTDEELDMLIAAHNAWEDALNLGVNPPAAPCAPPTDAD